MTAPTPALPPAGVRLDPNETPVEPRAVPSRGPGLGDRGMVGTMRSAHPHRLWPIGAAGLALIAALTSCNTTTSCTELSCDSEAIVTFPANAVTGAYDLVIDGEASMTTARCSDPAAPETADNPEGLSCDGQGFTLIGHPLADEREVLVTIIPLDGSPELSGLVRLEAIDEVTPNGPGCPPLCVIRNGRLTLADEG